MLRTSPLDLGADLDQQRLIFQEMMTAVPLPEDVITEPATIDGVPVGSDTDRQARFRWFAETPAHHADLDATKRIDPNALDLSTWLRRNR
jgi:hypothetical protein